MRRGLTGSYDVSTSGGETVKAFVPKPLPPVPPIEFTEERRLLLEKATLALGRLDSISIILPDPDLFLYSYVRREAVLSSQIEGTQSSISDLMLFEMNEAPGVPLDDVIEVSNYVAALDHGVKRMQEGFPLCNRLIREVHEVLLSRGRGSEKMPGEFRRTQNWIGGARPAKAHFVPTPPHLVEQCMGEFEQYLHADNSQYTVLVKAGLAHAQFETIHPFLDGNGRVGRLLIALILHESAMLAQPVLYLSLYFKRRRTEYYNLLDAVRFDGDFESWIDFFLMGVSQTATEAVETARKLVAIFQRDSKRVQSLGRLSSTALRVYESLRERPVGSIARLSKRTGLSFPAVNKAIQAIEKLGIVREITGKERNRVYIYGEYLDALSDGAEVK